MSEIKPTESYYRQWFIPTDSLPDEVFTKLAGDEESDISCSVCDENVHYRTFSGEYNEQLSGYVVFHDFVICGRCIDEKFGISKEMDDEIEGDGWLNGYYPTRGFGKHE